MRTLVTPTAPGIDSLPGDAAQIHDDLTRFRRDLHRHPEVGLDLPRTQERVLAAVDGLHLEVSTGTRTSSVTAVLRGAGGVTGSRPTVLLRADMDALPVHELAAIDYRSEVGGSMHACGHDLHTAMLVGAARLLDARRDSLPGDVVLMFQPGEEGYGGARIMIEEGVLDASGRPVDAAYGMHVFSTLAPHGTFVTKPGPMLAASDGFAVTVQGRGGHGSSPHAALDPVPAVAEMVLALQSAVTRSFDAQDPVVVTVGLLRAGTKRNVIPDEAFFDATVRTFSDAQRARVAEVLPRVVRGIAAAHGLTVDVQYTQEYPVTSNDVDETAFAADVLERMFDGRHTRWARPLAGSEDFSFVLQRVPGTFVGLGAAPVGADLATAEFNHSPRAVFDDGVLADGAALYAALALERLHQGSDA
ncbi:MAG: M20 family metallopeptidase [Lapillicoccus sp.]